MIRASQIVIAASLVALTLSPASGQAPAPPIDPTPLARPAPLTVVKGAAPADVLVRIRETLARLGYAVTTADRTSIDARKPDPAPGKGYDRVIIWAERDFDKPLEYLTLYLAYGRYEEVWGSRRDIYRIRVDAEQETSRTARVREALLRLER